MNCLVTVCISFIFGSTKDYFSLATSLGEFPGTIKRFWCIRYGTNIEVKIRDCPGAFGTDGGSETAKQLVSRVPDSLAVRRESGQTI